MKKAPSDPIGIVHVTPKEKNVQNQSSAVKSLPCDVQLLIEQGDLSVNLMSNSTYQLFGILIAGIAVIVTIASFMSINSAQTVQNQTVQSIQQNTPFPSLVQNLPIDLLLIFIVILLISKMPEYLTFQLQKYHEIRYRLITNYIANRDYGREIDDLKQFLNKISSKKMIYSETGFTFDFNVLLFLVLLVLLFLCGLIIPNQTLVVYSSVAFVIIVMMRLIVLPRIEKNYQD